MSSSPFNLFFAKEHSLNVCTKHLWLVEVGECVLTKACIGRQHSFYVCVRINACKMCTHLMQNKFIDKGVQSGSLLLLFVY